MSSLIRNIQESNDPRQDLDPPKIKVAQLPVLEPAPLPTAEQLGQPAPEPITLVAPPVAPVEQPLPIEEPVAPTPPVNVPTPSVEPASDVVVSEPPIEPDNRPFAIQDRIQTQGLFNSARPGIDPNSIDPQTQRPVIEGGQAGFEGQTQYSEDVGKSPEQQAAEQQATLDEQLRLGNESLMRNMDEALLYSNYLPTLYNGSAELADVFTQSQAARNNALTADAANTQRINEAFRVQQQPQVVPQTETDQAKFRPDSVAPFSNVGKWNLTGENVTANPFDPTKWQFGDSGNGALGAIIYGVGLLSNTGLGLAADVNNAADRYIKPTTSKIAGAVGNAIGAVVPDNIEKPVTEALQYDFREPLANGWNWLTSVPFGKKPKKALTQAELRSQVMPIQATNSPIGQHTLDALRGKQYTSSDYADLSSPFGVRQRGNGKWYEDDTFWTGIGMDILLDPAGLIAKGTQPLRQTGRVGRVVNNIAEGLDNPLGAAYTGVRKLVNGTPPPKGLLPPAGGTRGSQINTPQPGRFQVNNPRGNSPEAAAARRASIERAEREALEQARGGKQAATPSRVLVTPPPTSTSQRVLITPPPVSSVLPSNASIASGAVPSRVSIPSATGNVNSVPVKPSAEATAISTTYTNQPAPVFNIVQPPSLTLRRPRGGNTVLSEKTNAEIFRVNKLVSEGENAAAEQEIKRVSNLVNEGESLDELERLGKLAEGSPDSELSAAEEAAATSTFGDDLQEQTAALRATQSPVELELNRKEAEGTEPFKVEPLTRPQQELAEEIATGKLTPKETAIVEGDLQQRLSAESTRRFNEQVNAARQAAKDSGTLTPDLDQRIIIEAGQESRRSFNEALKTERANLGLPGTSTVDELTNRLVRETEELERLGSFPDLAAKQQQLIDDISVDLETAKASLNPVVTTPAELVEETSAVLIRETAELERLRNIPPTTDFLTLRGKAERFNEKRIFDEVLPNLELPKAAVTAEQVEEIVTQMQQLQRVVKTYDDVSPLPGVRGQAAERFARLGDNDLIEIATAPQGGLSDRIISKVFDNEGVAGRQGIFSSTFRGAVDGELIHGEAGSKLIENAARTLSAAAIAKATPQQLAYILKGSTSGEILEAIGVKLKNTALETQQVKVAQVKEALERVPVQNAEQSTIPQVSGRVFQGEYTISELARLMSENIPGTQVDGNLIQKSRRTKEQVLALMKLIPAPDGKPLVSASLKRLESWKQVGDILQRRGVEDRSYYRLFDREGAPIDMAALDSETFRVVLDKPATFKGATESVVVDNTPRQAREVLEGVETLKGATEVKVENGVRSYKLPGYEPKARKADDFRGNLIRERNVLRGTLDSVDDIDTYERTISRIEEIESELRVPNVVRNQEHLEQLKREQLPDNIQVSNPQLIQKRIDVEADVFDAADDVKVANADIKVQQYALEQTLVKAERTANIGRQDVFIKAVEQQLKLDSYNLPQKSFSTNPPSVKPSQVQEVVKNPFKAFEKNPEVARAAEQNLLEGNANKVNAKTFFHGTRVENWQPGFDPLIGGKRAEWGQAVYLTDGVSLAREASKADISMNTPDVPGRQFSDESSVLEVKPDLQRVVDVELPYTPTTQRVFREALDDVLDKFDPLDRKVIKQFDYFSTPHMKDGVMKYPNKPFKKLYTYVERSLLKFYSEGIPEELLTDIYQRINLGLRSEGIDGLTDGSTLAVLNSEKLKVLGKEAVGDADLDGIAVARFNTDSAVAAKNPELPTAQVDFIESSARAQNTLLQSALKHQEDLLNKAKAKIDEMLELDNELMDTASREKLQNLDIVVKNVRSDIQDGYSKLNKTNNNPCSF